MRSEIFRDLKEGALDALRLFAALFSAPFIIGRDFVMRPPGEPFRWPREVGRSTAIEESRR
jgi:hypothetical protein